MSDDESAEQARPGLPHLDTLVEFGPGVAVTSGPGVSVSTETRGPVLLHRAWSREPETLCGCPRSDFSDASVLHFRPGVQLYPVPRCKKCEAAPYSWEPDQP
jgi:hypothetical protein